MKVIYVGDFKQPYSTENYVAYGLRENGVEVKTIQEDSEMTSQMFLAFVKEFKPDFVLFCKNRFFGRGDLLVEKLKEEGVLTVTWLFDLYFDLPKEMGVRRTVHDAAFQSDVVFTSDGGHEEQFYELGINHYLLRQGIHAPEAHYGNKIDAPEILFIGTNSYTARDELLSALRKRYGDRFCHYGTHAHKPETRGEALNDLVTSAKIVVGDSVPSPYYWSNRIYEVLGRGGFLVHPKVKGLEKEFEYYKHFIPFDYGRHEQLFEIIDYYLDHDEDREKIRKAGHEYVKQNLTYTKRCQTLLREITGIIEQRKPKNQA